MCSRIGLPVRAETANTCWVFTLNSFVLNPILAFFVVDYSRKEIVAGATATFLAFRLRNTKVIIIAVLRVSHICCYCVHYYYSWYLQNIILHKHSLLHFYLKPFFILQIPHKNRIQLKTHKRGDEERRKRRKTKNPLRSSKSTVCCFGEGIQLNLLTLIQVSAILSGTHSGRQLANRLGLCSRSGLPVRAETSSTCLVFTLNYFVLNLILAFFVVDYSRKEIVAGATATFLDFPLRNTKVILIAVFRVSRIRCYCR